MLIGGAFSIENAFRYNPQSQIVFLNDNLTLPWLTSLPDDDILWCYWKYELGGAWDQFLGYHNVDKKRLNISPWNKGWEYLNTDHPCKGGIMRQHVTSEYSGNYVMVIADHNGTEYESVKFPLTVAGCPRPAMVAGADITTYAHGEFLVAVYKCQNKAEGEESRRMECDPSTGTWNGKPPICPDTDTGVSSVAWILLAFVILLCVGIALLTLHMARGRQRQQRQKQKGERKALPETQQNLLYHRQEPLEFDEVFQAEKVDVHEQLTLTVVVNDKSSKVKVKWSKDGQELDSSERICMKSEKRDTYHLVITDVTAEDSGIYSVTANKEGSGTVEHSGRITVITNDMSEPEFVTELSVPMVVQRGESKIYVGQIKGNPTPEVTCYKNDKLLSSSDNIQLTTDHTDAGSDISLLFTEPCSFHDAAQSIKVHAQNVLGMCEYETKLEVHGIPRVVDIIGTDFFRGEDAKFQAKIESFQAPENIEWYIGKELVLPSSKLRSDSDCPWLWVSELVRPKCLLKSGTELKIKISHQSMTSEKTTKLKVKCRKPKFVRELTDQEATVGEDVSLSVRLYGRPEPRVLWYKGGQLLEMSQRIIATSSSDSDTVAGIRGTLTIRQCRVDDSGRYTAIASNVASDNVQSSADVIIREAVIN